MDRYGDGRHRATVAQTAAVAELRAPAEQCAVAVAQSRECHVRQCRWHAVGGQCGRRTQQAGCWWALPALDDHQLGAVAQLRIGTGARQAWSAVDWYVGRRRELRGDER